MGDPSEACSERRRSWNDSLKNRLKKGIMKTSLTAILMLSILEISWGIIKSNTFTRIPFSKINDAIIASLAVKSCVLCSSACLRASDCDAFNCSPSNPINCQLKYPSSVTIVSDLLYHTYIGQDGLPLQTDTPGKEGSWGDDLRCARGSFVYGFSLWFDAYNGKGLGTDDCGVFGIKIMCRTTSGVVTESATFNQEYQYGSKQADVSCSGTRLVHGFRTWMGPDMLKEDEEGLCNLKIKCYEGNTISSSILSNSGKILSTWTFCPTATFMCGLRPRYVALGADDETCFNDILIYCCVIR